MKTHIPPRIKKALLASMSFLALSLTCSPTIAKGANFDWKNVDDEDFVAQRLIESSWEGASAVRTDFCYADLTRANFKNANLTDALFMKANLTDAILEGATIQGADFNRIVGNSSAENPYYTVTHDMLMSTKSWNDKDLSRASFNYADLSGLNFTNFNLSDTYFSFANFTRVDFTKANLNNADLSFANFTGAVLTDANIQGADFGGVVGNDSTVNPTHTVTHAMLMSTESWQNKDLSGVDFTKGDLSGLNFTNFNLSGAEFWRVNLSGADMRGANMTNAESFNANDHTNIINTDGKIHNFTLSSAADTLTIRAVENIHAYLDGTTATISGGATLTLTENAVLELTSNTQLTLADDGHLSLVFDTTAPSSLTSIVIKSGSSLIIESNAILDITINDLSMAGFKVDLLSWEDDADVADLLTRLEDDTDYRINGYTLEELGLYTVIDHDNNILSIIPEPSTATLSLLALAGLLARRRREVA